MNTEASQKSLKGLYVGILYQIADNMSKEDRAKFELWASEDLSKSTLETGQPLKWFSDLQRKGKIAPEDLSYLEEFLYYSGLQKLLSKVKRYKTECHELMSKSKKNKKKKKATKTREHTDDNEGGMALDLVDNQRGFEGKKPKQDIAFELFQYEIDSFLKNSSLVETECRSLSCQIEILAHQVFGQPTSAALKTITERPQSVQYSSDSQCMLERKQNKDTEMLWLSIHGLEQRTDKQFRALKQALGLVATAVLLFLVIFRG